MGARPPTAVLIVALNAGILLMSGSAPAQSLTTVRVAGGHGTANELRLPVYATAAPNDPARLFIVEQRGVIRILDLTLDPPAIKAVPFLDIQTIVWNLNGFTDERGLLGMAFDPQYEVSGRFYLFYSDVNGASVVARYSASPDPDVADAQSGTVLLTIPQPFHNHRGGCLQFGPDGLLYASAGDSGSGCDPLNLAQNPEVMNGKMLRLNVNAATPDAEIWAMGLRNPWRFSFDRATGDLYIADVGEVGREEINYLSAARLPATGPLGFTPLNFGWKCCEGDVPSTISGCSIPDACFTVCNESHDEYIAPILAQAHTGAGNCITGGYVYRGTSIKELAGTYLFGDFMSGKIWSMKVVGGEVTALTDRTAELQPDTGRPITFVASFGEDAAGELYIICRGAFDTSTGEIFQIVPDRTITCPADIASSSGAGGDGVVGVPDLLAVINAWGPCPEPCPPSCDADVNDDCAVGVADLLAIINAWGPCN